MLTAADEVALAKQYKISVQVTAQRKLLTEVKGSSGSSSSSSSSNSNSKATAREVSNDELAASLGITTEHLLQLIEKGTNAKRVLVQANMRLIFHIARFYRYRGVSYPDLVQEGKQ